MTKLDNTKELLTAAALPNPWQQFHDYHAQDLSQSDLLWSVPEEARSSAMIMGLINQMYQERSDRLHAQALRFCDGLPFIMQHMPLLILDTQTGLKAVFLDSFWGIYNEENETPAFYKALHVRQLIFVASFDKACVKQVQRLFKEARWSQILVLSDFERRFLIDSHRQMLIPKRQSQYQIFRYILSFFETSEEVLKGVFKPHNFPDYLLDLYKKIQTLNAEQTHEEVLRLFIGPKASRGENWNRTLITHMRQAGLSYAKALLAAIITHLTSKVGEVLPNIPTESKPPETQVIINQYKQFARAVLPAKPTEEKSEIAIKSPVVFQSVSMSDDYLTDYEEALDAMLQLSGMIERAILNNQTKQSGQKDWSSKYSAGDIASRLMARFLTLLHQNQAIYHYEDFKDRTGMSAVLIFFDEGFLEFASDVMYRPHITQAELESRIAGLTLHNLCAQISKDLKDAVLSAELNKFGEHVLHKKILAMPLIGHPTTEDGEKCPILNIKISQKGSLIKADFAQLADCHYWIFSNMPFDDAQLKALQDDIIHKKPLPNSILYTLPKGITPVEQSRRELLDGLLKHQTALPRTFYNHRKFLVGNEVTQTQLMAFDKTQKLPPQLQDKPTLKNCIVAGDGEYILQRLSFKPRQSIEVIVLLEEMLDDLLKNIYEMMTSDRAHYKSLVSYYRRQDKNPEAAFFQDLPNDHWQALYLYYKQLQKTDAKTQEAQVSFKQALRYLELILKGYLVLPFYVLRNEGAPASLSHLLGMRQQGVLLETYNHTQQIVLIINKQLPPFSALGFDAVHVIDAIVSGDTKNSTKNSGVIHRQSLKTILNRLYQAQHSQATKGDMQDFGIEGNLLLHGEFLVSLQEFELDNLGSGDHAVPIRKLEADDMIKVLSLGELRDELSIFFDLLPTLEDEILIIPKAIAKKYQLNNTPA